MDKAYLRDLIWAIKAELIKFRFWFVALFIGISFSIMLIGVFWPKNYSTTTMLYADITNIIEPLLKGSAEVTKIDRSEQAKNVIYTRAILVAAAKSRGLIKNNMTPEQEDWVIKGVRDNIKIKSERNSNSFYLTYDARDPDQSFEMLNSIINEFISYTEKKKRDESSNAYNFIDAQVQSYKHQLELAEDKLKDFNSKNIDGNEGQVTSRITQLNTDIETLKISIEESQSRVASLQQQLGNEGQYQHTKNQIDEMKQRRLTLSNQLDQLLLTYQEEYPDIVSIRGQIADLDAAIKKMQVSGEVYSNSEKVENPLYEEIRKQLSAAEVDLKSQRRRMESFQRLLEQEHARAERVASNQAQFSELTRDYDVTRKVYEEMLQRKEAARLSMTLDQQGQGVSYRIQEPATFPLKPTGLQFIYFAIAGPILAFLIPLGLVFAFVIVDPHIRSARVLQQQLSPEIEMLGVIPHYNSPLRDRMLRKDILAILAVSIIALVVYIIFAVYWQYLKG